MSHLKASKEDGVPHTTIEARVKIIKIGKLNRDKSAEKGPGRHKPVFPPEQEEELVQYILLMEAPLFELSLDKLRSLAFQLAELNLLKHQFNKNKQKVIKAWLDGSLERHPNIKLRSPEPTSLVRAIGFNRPAVEKLFNLLSQITTRYL